MYIILGVGLISWSPLAGGILSGKYEDGVPVGSRAAQRGFEWLKRKILSEDGRKQQLKIRKLTHLANSLQCSLPQLAIGISFFTEHSKKSFH